MIYFLFVRGGMSPLIWGHKGASATGTWWGVVWTGRLFRVVIWVFWRVLPSLQRTCGLTASHTAAQNIYKGYFGHGDARYVGLPTSLQQIVLLVKWPFSLVYCCCLRFFFFLVQRQGRIVIDWFSNWLTFFNYLWFVIVKPYTPSAGTHVHTHLVAYRSDPCFSDWIRNLD